ncbi:MAG: hypothetical protein DI563_30615 [Variovorax paradoxus]|uniref:DUF4124 domain-containing protein n=1 Tax=Variovorax paradoxus TaxID=34073 RepID=A0A2W5NZ74_VARPD|nr:MAG: hypothetical protein DI563_30615 [Variovorax paradoxus]
MKSAPLLCLCLGAVLAGPAFAMYRCEAADGTISFQDKRCPEGSKEQTLGATAPPPLVSGPDDGQRAQQIRRNQEASTRALRKTQLESTLLPAARSALASHRQACEQELSALRAQREGTSGRFPGQRQTLDESLAAAQARCDRQGRELADRVETLRSECSALQCTAR